MNKKLILLIILLLNMNKLQAQVVLEDMEVIKPNFYRVGTNDKIESRYKKIENTKLKELHGKITRKSQIDWTKLSLKNISNEITYDLEDNQADITSDLQLLWNGAASLSESIKYAIYKLSNPDGGKQDDTMVKKIIKPLANFTSLAGMGLGDPFISTAAIASGALLGQLSVTDNDLNYKYTKVTDADMIVLMRKIDELQKKLAKNYFEYMGAYNQLKLANSTLEYRNRRYKRAEKLNNKAHILIADAYYKTACDNYEKAKSDFMLKRSSLEKLVGDKTLKEFETGLKNRDK